MTAEMTPQKQTLNISYSLLNTLYVFTEASWLHLDNDTVRIEVERETKLRVPLHHLCSIVVHGDVLISPALLARAMERAIGVVYLSRGGKFLARVEGAMSGNVHLRLAQYAAFADPNRARQIAIAMVAGKLRNSRSVLLRSARDSAVAEESAAISSAAQHLSASLRTLPTRTDLDAVRGVEGDAARVYFSQFDTMIKPELRKRFAFDARTRRPPRNAVNALLSYLYAVLTHDCRSALESVGLDPQLGFLHAPRPGRPALALDLVEEFRAVMADRTALTLINRGQLHARDFHESKGGAFELAGDARKLVIGFLQERKRETVHHPILNADVPFGLLPQIQARLLARHLRGELEFYPPYLHR
jgi:CRISP-associated protein Cas1